MSNQLLEGMIIVNQKIISSEEGSIFHVMKKRDQGFKGFGEVYFSTVVKDCVKAWKLHHKMTLNLTVPVGVLFTFFDPRKESRTPNHSSKILMSQNPYFRLTVPPGIWFGFKGLSEGLNIVCNIADIEHDKNEISRKSIGEISIDWSIN